MIAIGLYGISFVISLGPLPTVLSTELFSNKQRGLCGSIALSAQWVGNLIVTFTFPIVFNNLPTWLPFALFCGCCLFALCFVVLFLPETKGVPLEEVEDLLSHRLVHLPAPFGPQQRQHHLVATNS